MEDAAETLIALRNEVSYDPLTGVFLALAGAKGRHATTMGRPLGNKRPDGYIVFRVNKHLHRAHRLAWLWMTGQWPSGVIDHINRDRADNRFANLRDTTQSVNVLNGSNRKLNPYGVRGVKRAQYSNDYMAYIGFHGRRRHLGSFATVEEASQAYERARAQLLNPDPT